MLYHPPLVPMPDVPIAQHPGAFGVKRKFDVHGGVDLYAPIGEPVYAVESGIVVYCDWYTGSKCGTPWWNDSRAMYVEGDTATLVYGEIQELEHIKKGDTVQQGQLLGSIVAVLKKDKGRPMSMLHFAMKQKGYDILRTKEFYTLNLDPTMLLLQCKLNSLLMEK